MNRLDRLGNPNPPLPHSCDPAIPVPASRMPAPSASPPALIALWQGLASGRPFASGRALDEAEISWAIATGMGPLLYAANLETPGSVPEDLLARLQAADRWARVQHADMLDAAVEIIDRCADRAPPLTLLKGISIGGEYYPSPYQRVLGDLDLLVEPEDAPAVAAALDELGYRPSEGPPELDFATHHHLRPVSHPQTQICVEVHTGLFPPSLRFDEGSPFSLAVVRAERRASTLDGRRVFRLSAELQVPYIASHWALDFVPTAAGARALLDMTLLLRGAADRIDWARVLGWLGDRRIAAHLHLMLSYLEAQALVELPPALHASWERVAVLPPAVLRILGGMVDRYQVRGLMRSFRPPPRGRGAQACRAAAGTLRSRLHTLRTAAADGNLRGLLQPVDRTAWETLLCQPPTRWTRVVAAWCLLFPLGDPDRFAPGRRLARRHSAVNPPRRRR